MITVPGTSHFSRTEAVESALSAASRSVQHRLLTLPYSDPTLTWFS